MSEVNVGDIILINNYVDNGRNLSRHSFVVISVDAGEIQGLDYDVICNVLSSFKNDEQRERKLKYPGNFEILNENSSITGGNDKDGYVKAEQFYFFKLDKINYSVIGTLNVAVLKKLLSFIASLGLIALITDNL